MQNFDHDKELLKATINLIAAEIPGLGAEAEQQIQAGNWAEGKRALHTIKGHCKLIGELGFAQFIQQLEKLLTEQQKPGDDALLHLKENLRLLQQRLRMLSQ